MKILIMGLPGAGKTTLAKALSKELNAVHLNADEIRSLCNDFDFSHEGRIRQAKRMSMIADNALTQTKYVICDFVCPTNETRNAFGKSFIIWVNRIDKGRFEDTNKLFEKPNQVDVCINAGLTVEEEINLIKEKVCHQSY